MDPLHSVQGKKKDPEPIHCQAHHTHDEQNHILYSQSNSVAQCHQIKSKAPHIYHKSIFEWGVYMLFEWGALYRYISQQQIGSCNSKGWSATELVKKKINTRIQRHIKG